MTSIVVNPFVLGSVTIAAPGTITLGTPDAFGIPYTMPSLPSGAGSLIIQASTDNATWTDCMTGLTGGATGYFNLSPTAGSAIGHQNELTYLRAKNTNGGAVGTSTSATTVDLPATPDASTGVTEIDETYTLRVSAPAMPARGYELLAYMSASFGENPPTTYYGTVPESNYADFTGYAGGGGTVYVGLVAQNLYGPSAMSSTVSIALIATPGAITPAGDPDGNGIPFAMPTLPTGAGDFIMESSNDDAIWHEAIYSLASEESGYFNKAYDGGSPLGHGGEDVYLRAKNTNGGKTGPSIHAVTVTAPTDPPISGASGGISSDCDPDTYKSYGTTPDQDFANATAVKFRAYTGSGNPPADLAGEFDRNEGFDSGCVFGPESSSYLGITEWNIYGEGPMDVQDNGPTS